MKINIAGQTFELSEEQVQAAQESGTVNIEGDYVIRSSEEEETFKNNLLTSSNATAYEIARKNVLKNLGIETNGQHKSDEGTLNAINTYLDGKVTNALNEAGKKPNEKLAEYEKDLTTLKGTIEALTLEKENAIKQFSDYKKSNTIESTLNGLIPDNVAFPKKDMLTVIKSHISADIDEHGNVFAIGRDGQPIKDSRTLQLTPIEDVVKGWFNDNPTYLKGASGGAGGSDSSGQGSTKQSIEDFMQDQKAKGINPGTKEFADALTEAQKKGTIEL